MSDVEYNLLDERWLVARRKDGTVSEYSLLELFEHAHELRNLSGELPVQDVAVLRMLIAVVETVYQSTDESGGESEIDDVQEALRRWKAVWDAGCFDMGMIGTYLEGYRDRFYLFHPDRPFYQAPIGNGTRYYVSKLNGELSESKHKPRLFTSVGGVNKKIMSYPEAARWLLYINGFDDRSGKPTPSLGWLGELGLVYVEGDNLFETILLNTVLLSDEGEPFPTGIPAWEHKNADVRRLVKIETPESPVEILTLQSRRLLLQRNDEGVTGYLLLGGDIVEKENALVEQMTVWRLTKENQWTPRRHDPSRAMWRDFQSLLVKAEHVTGKQEFREPGVVCWVSRLVEEGFLSDSEVTIRTVGTKYGGSMESQIDDYISDSLTINRGLLDKVGDDWNCSIADLITKIERCVNYLGSLVEEIAKINGLKDTSLWNTVSNAKSVAYYGLDIPFRNWLRSVEPNSQEFDNKSMEWLKTMERILLRQGNEVLNNAGNKAIVGKKDKRGNENNAILSFEKFKNQLFNETR